MNKIYARPFAVATLALTLAVGAAGCQTISDLDPTGLIGDDGSAAAPDTQFPPDSQQQATQDANTTTPDLASLPARPPQPDATAQAATTQQVTAAGAQAQYSADALRAGTDAAAPPPTATDAAATKQAMAAINAPPTASADAPPTAGSADTSAPPTASAPAPAAAPAASNPNAAVPAQQVASAAPAPAAAAPAAEPAAAPLTAAAPSANPPPVASAPIPAPPGAEPAVPAVPMTPGAQMAMLNPSDAQLGFKPSSAPPLNPSVSQWVSPPILAHYRETAARAGSAGTAEPAVAAVPATSGRHGRSAMGGSAVSGDVVANLDAVPGSPLGRVAAMNGGVPPTQIIYFPGDTTSLSKSAMGQVRSAVEAFQAGGGAGTIKVVGHASSRTGNMPVERHLEVIFQKSQARANAVAQALIRAGVPADKVQIEAVGDSQPIYYESMPKGEDGNRRAEIFVQG
jgi:outer membrane protein OmpA-like peptidoglycan-associated protein